MRFKGLFSFFIFVILFFVFIPSGVKADQVSPPIIVEASHRQTGSSYVTGLTPAETEVLVYIDGDYMGLAEVQSKGTATDNFYFKYPADLPEGEHEIMAIARDKTSLVLSLEAEDNFVLSGLPAPTLISPKKEDAIGRLKPFITGLSADGSFVHIYIDGVYNGKTEVLSHESGTANFAYKPFLNLEVGWHEVWVVAEDRQGKKSFDSNTLNFKIEHPMPAPTMFEPVVNSQTKSSQPFIVGLAKNNSRIKVFIDKKLNGEFHVQNHESGTANFAYKPASSLTRGEHLVYTTAIDDRGKESRWSNIIYLTIKQPAIAESAQETKKEDEIGSQVEIISLPGEVKSIKELEEIQAGEIKEKARDITKEARKSGLVDENQKNRSRSKFNLMIFLAFLAGIILWIIWVNKELIKERKSGQEDKEDPGLDL